MLLGLRRKQTPAVDWKYARLGDVLASGPDEPPMTACGGNFIGGEIRRNEQCPLCGLATIEPADEVAIPDAKHPVKARGILRGKASSPPQDFPCFPRMLCIRDGDFVAGPEAITAPSRA